jgi:hypothetical protein
VVTEGEKKQRMNLYETHMDLIPTVEFEHIILGIITVSVQVGFERLSRNCDANMAKQLGNVGCHWFGELWWQMIKKSVNEAAIAV